MPVVSLEKLAEWSPFKSHVWDGLKEPVTMEEVELALQEGRLLDETHSSGWYRRDHVERIAYLVVHKDPTPLELDVGIPQLGCHVEWPIEDGHHRLAAAIFRGDSVIDINAAGSVDHAEELFGVPFPRTVADRVLEAVMRAPGRTAHELLPKLDGLTRGSVSARLSELERLGRVRSGGTPKRYWASIHATAATTASDNAHLKSRSRNL